MFYENTDCGYKILNIYYVERKERDVFESNRQHTAISYRIKGCSTFYTHGQQFQADTGTVTYIPAGCDYRHKNDAPENIIILHLAGIGNIETQLQIQPDVTDLEPLFRTLLDLWGEGGVSAYNRCMSLLYQIFALLQQKKAEVTTPIPRAIAPGIEMLRKNFRNPHLTVANLAKECFVSEVYFRRVYRAYAGQSPLQAILELRFQYARNLLSSGYYTCKQAAQLSGFSDVKYFRTAFKKRYGETPSEFATNIRRR